MIEIPIGFRATNSVAVIDWPQGLIMARDCSDVTYEEWCNMYVSRIEPSSEQIMKALKTAYPILVRNGLVEEFLTFNLTQFVGDLTQVVYGTNS